MKIIQSYGKVVTTDSKAFENAEAPMPKVQENDLLVEVKAVSVNPVDTKLRHVAADDTPVIYGYDAAGVVKEIGTDVTGFKSGDRVYYSGTTIRPGANEQYQAVDFRLVGLSPTTLTDAQSAALPLTAITAGEVLFEKMGFVFEKNANQGQNLLIINGAGGVGSVAIQLAKWSGLSVTATASREQTIAWIKDLGADNVINHRKDLGPQVKSLGIVKYDGVLILTSTDQYFDVAASLVKPFGHVASIVESEKPVKLGLLKGISASFDWEFMFAKSVQNIRMETQGQLLNSIAKLVDAGEVKTTLTENIDDGINADTVRKAHLLVESGKMIGKVVVSGPFNG